MLQRFKGRDFVKSKRENFDPIGEVGEVGEVGEIGEKGEVEGVVEGGTQKIFSDVQLQ